MDDLISRQAAIEAIATWDWQDAYLPIHFKQVLEELPSAEPEIIRCKDCKWYEADIMGNPWGVCFHRDRILENVGFQMDENSYCSMGERREDG